jgi:phosphoserine aminotransferase
MTVIGIVPASDTGAVEMALWSLLGPRPVTMLAWESSAKAGSPMSSSSSS